MPYFWQRPPIFRGWLLRSEGCLPAERSLAHVRAVCLERRENSFIGCAFSKKKRATFARQRCLSNYVFLLLSAMSQELKFKSATNAATVTHVWSGPGSIEDTKRVCG